MTMRAILCGMTLGAGLTLGGTGAQADGPGLTIELNALDPAEGGACHFVGTGPVANS